ncbi:AraC family transcriptional regulator [Lentilactobacillus hilgardii]|uniref:AraC family transcriptional regulator n=1 Tax=Lentilactobacillus hilgardii TaxID=1588 RepID=UPI0021A5098D|nr:AraC family transcriptional regulator [Lentilactobacillus hilgardii]MCT3400685.1 AraC family transcriptional regulator [Lentilactobacillus hilgardii]
MNEIKLPVDGTLKEDVVCFHNRNKYHDSPFHQHPSHYELYLFISGNTTFYTKTTAYPMKPGYLVAIPNGHWHRAVTNGSTTYERIFLNINTRLVKELSTSNTDLSACFFADPDKEVSIRTLTEDEMNKFKSLCHQLITILGDSNYANDIRERILLTRILLLANTVDKIDKEPENVIPSLLQQMTQFIDTNLSGDLSLTAFSKHFYLSQAYLNRYFKSYMGLTLHRYILEKRIAQAKKELNAGHSVTEVSESCGFGNYSNFIRTFKKNVGTPPGKYKKD